MAAPLYGISAPLAMCLLSHFKCALVKVAAYGCAAVWYNKTVRHERQGTLGEGGITPAAEGRANEDLRSTRIMAFRNMKPCNRCLRGSGVRVAVASARRRCTRLAKYTARQGVGGCRQGASVQRLTYRAAAPGWCCGCER